MSQQKILQLVTLSEMGGAQKVVYYLAAGLNREKFAVTVACGPGGELVGWLKKLPAVKVIELDCLKREISPLKDALCLLQLYRLFKSGGYDIVHCHSSKAGILGRLAAYLAGVPKIFFTAHGWGIGEWQPFLLRRLFILAERLAGRVNTRVVSVSEYDRKKGMAFKLVDAAKIVVIYNGVPDNVPSKANGITVRGEFGFGVGNVVIGTTMRLALPKQPLLFLEAAKRLLAEDMDRYRFIIVGDGPLRSQCQEYISQNKLQGQVILAGNREDVPRLLTAFDISALFSAYEGLPLTIIEAMLAGVPVVASNVGGVGEVVVHGETGYLVSGPDIGTAVEYIKGLADNGELRAKMGLAGRKRAKELFDLDVMIGRYEQLYRGAGQ